MLAEGGLRAEIRPGVGSLPAGDWHAALPDEAEGWDYYRACGNDLAAAVFDERGLVLGVPLFRMEYRLDTPFQGRLAEAGRLLTRLLPGLMCLRMLAVGSPLAERCHVALRPGLPEPARERAFALLLSLLEVEAGRLGADIVVLKDLAERDAGWMAPLLAGQHFHAIRGLPVAVLDLSFEDVESYVASLSSATRKHIRRKLKARQAVRVERRENIDDVAFQIEALYRSTRDNSKLRYGDFEELPEGYFSSIAAALPGKVCFMLYWVGEKLAAFNLLFLEPDRVIDKFLGMAYPLAREHNLYVVSWMENVRLAIETGRAGLQSGQTAYASKLRFGSRLVPSTNFVRSRSRVMNRIIGWLRAWMDFERWDPDLRALRDKRAENPDE